MTSPTTTSGDRTVSVQESVPVKEPGLINELQADADATIYGGKHASNNHGTAPTLDTKEGQDPNWCRKAYIRFDLKTISRSFKSAKLRLYTVDGGPDNGVKLVTNDTWQETAITWQNAPTPTDAVLATWRPTTGKFVELDLTQVVQQEYAGDKQVTFLIYDLKFAGRSANASYASREAAVPAQRPVLIIRE